MGLQQGIARMTLASKIYLQKLLSKVSRDCLNKSQPALDRILGGTNLAKMREDLLHCQSDEVKLM